MTRHVLGAFLFLVFLSAQALFAQEAAMKPNGFKPALENVLLEAPAARSGEKVGVI